VLLTRKLNKKKKKKIFVSLLGENVNIKLKRHSLYRNGPFFNPLKKDINLEHTKNKSPNHIDAPPKL